MVQTASCISDGSLSCQSQNGKHNSALKAPNNIKFRHKRRIIVFMWGLWFAYISLTHDIQPVSCGAVPSSQPIKDDTEPNLILNWDPLKGHTGSLLKATPANTSIGNISVNNNPISTSTSKLLAGLTENCTEPAILDFPPDLFTQAQRQKGAIIVQFIISLYVFYAIAIICDEYFIPSIEVICGELQISDDVAGATVMAVATSSPELFTNIIATFITEGDIGVGTIVGSAVFNILAVCACCAFAAKTALPLDWYPLTRDYIFYSISVMLLILVIHNRQVFWYEALVMVGVYVVYIFVMWKNAAFKKATENFVHAIGKEFGWNSNSSTKPISNAGEKTPLLSKNLPTSPEAFRVDSENDLFKPKNASPAGDYNDNAEVYDNASLISSSLHGSEEETENNEDSSWGIFKVPSGKGFLVALEWVTSWPARCIFTCTIPDCQRNRKLYPLTFIMCILYLAVLSYVVNWMITVIGHTFGIPDSVMGLTLLALGTSIPEAISSIIVARKGLASMSISNSIGSNTFDILLCLGLPWLIRTAMIANDPERNFVQINSGGLEYSVIILMISLVLMYTVLACNKFYLDKKVATFSLAVYAVFLVFASLCEMNVFFTVNLPTCAIPSDLL